LTREGHGRILTTGEPRVLRIGVSLIRTGDEIGDARENRGKRKTGFFVERDETRKIPEGEVGRH